MTYPKDLRYSPFTMKLEHITTKPTHTAPIPAFDFLFAASDKRPASAAKRERSWLQRPLRTRRV